MRPCIVVHKNDSPLWFPPPEATPPFHQTKSTTSGPITSRYGAEGIVLSPSPRRKASSIKTQSVESRRK
ncbi:hypothetical protein TNCV_328371 [Trichonephila clavipes]|nr:hypothetical protein TNCV_328371 [Trichonephila clavipes]